MTLLYLDQNDRMGQLDDALAGKQIMVHPLESAAGARNGAFMAPPGVLT